MKKVGTVVERDMRERPRAFQADGARADPQRLSVYVKIIAFMIVVEKHKKMRLALDNS